MNPVTKTLIIVLASILSIFIIPAILIIFHDYIYAFIFITSVLASFILFGYYSYQELLPFIQRNQLEEEAAFHRFHGDKDKLKYYHGFKKHFDGELNLEQLEKWLERHPSKH